MKRKSLSIAAIGLLSAGLLLPMTALAETTQQNASTTTGTVAFSEPTTPVKPVDPTDPDTPATGETGPLTLDVLPNLNFGSHEIASGSQTYSVEKPAKPEIQASDRRGVGNDNQAQGWTVNVSMTDFTLGGAANAQKLEGVSLDFSSGSVKPASSTQGDAPTAQDVTGLNSADGAKTILGAKHGQGLGTWVSSYDPSNIKLTVPKAAKGAFQATLSWTINDSTVQ